LREFGKPGCERGKEAQVSHDSHRDRKLACVKGMFCVKSVSEAAQGNGFESTRDAQQRFFDSAGIELAGGSKNQKQKLQKITKQFPTALAVRQSFPFQHLVCKINSVYLKHRPIKS
jgi:hypothetical protein